MIDDGNESVDDEILSPHLSTIHNYANLSIFRKEHPSQYYCTQPMNEERKQGVEAIALLLLLVRVMW